MRYKLSKLDKGLFPRSIEIGGVKFHLQTHDVSGAATYTKRPRYYWGRHYNYHKDHLQVVRGQEALVYCFNQYIDPDSFARLKAAIDEGWDVNYSKVIYQYKDGTANDWDEEVVPAIARVDLQLWVNVWITEEQRVALKAEVQRVKDEAKKAEEREQRRQERELRAAERETAAAQQRAELAAQIRLEGKSQKKAMTLAAAIQTLQDNGMEVTITGHKK